MELVLIVGTDAAVAGRARDDALAAALQGGPRDQVERVDVALDGGDALVAAVGSPSLFSPRRIVDCWNIDAIDASNLARLAEAAPASDAVVVARAQKLPVATRRKMPPHTAVTASAPTERDLPAAIRQRASQLGVRLTGDQVTTIVMRCRDHPQRAWSVVEQLALVRVTRPKDRQVETLLGTTWPVARPWELAARAESGDLRGALEMFDRAGPDAAFGLLGYLRKSLLELAVAVRCADERDLAGRLGITAQRASQLARRAKRVEPTLLADALRAVCAAEDALRSTGVREASVDLAIAAYARCLGGTATATAG